MAASNVAKFKLKSKLAVSSSPSWLRAYGSQQQGQVPAQPPAQVHLCCAQMAASNVAKFEHDEEELQRLADSTDFKALEADLDTSVDICGVTHQSYLE